MALFQKLQTVVDSHKSTSMAKTDNPRLSLVSTMIRGNNDNKDYVYRTVDNGKYNIFMSVSLTLNSRKISNSLLCLKALCWLWNVGFHTFSEK